MQRESVRQKVFIPFCVLVILVSIGLGVLCYRVLVDSLTSQQRETLALHSGTAAKHIGQLVEYRRTVIRDLAHSDAAERYAQNYAFYSLSGLFVAHAETFPSLSFINERGAEEERTSAGQAVESYRDLSDTDLFRQAAAYPNAPHMSAIEAGATGESGLRFMYHYRNFFDEFGGVILGFTPLSDLTEPARQASIGHLGFIVVVDAAGEVLAYPDRNRLSRSIYADDGDSARLLEAALAGQTAFGRASILGVDGYVASAPVPGTGWRVIATLPFDEFIEAPMRLRNQIIMATLVTLLVLFAVAWWLSRYITRPLESLLQATESVAQGDFSHPASIESGDEFQILGEAFNRMSRERRLAEDGLRRARDEAEAARELAVEAARAKAEFLARMSHEIRTPMNGVIAMADYLVRTDLDIPQRDCAETIKLSGAQLLRVVNDILDYSKIESGKVALESSFFDMRDLIEQTAELVAEGAVRKEVEVIPVVPPRVPNEICCDEGRIRQVLANLAANAVKFTDGGEVSIHGDLEEVAGQLHLHCEVRDTGVGIALEDREKIFESFAQADSLATRRYEGTGLGLAICRQLIKLMGGEIGVESELGLGSKFWFRVPVGRGGDARATGETRVRGYRVLLVEDNLTAQTVLAQQLRALGLYVTPVSNHRRAMALLIEEPYDLVVVDRTLRGMDGVKLVEQIRAEIVPTPRIVLLLSEPIPEAGIEGIGVDAALGKPVLRRQLAHCVERALSGEPSEAIPGTVKTPPPPDNPHAVKASVLVAEDNPMNQRVARRLLERLGCEVVLAQDGSEALRKSEQDEFDLIFIDCHMPEMDGYELTRLMRAREQDALPGRRLPIIAMTANVISDSLTRCEAAGMDDFLSKPYDLDDLSAVLRRWLPRYPSAA